MQNRSDLELMRLVQQKQRDALEVLYDRYVKLVYSFALKSMNNELAAKEIVQLVFTRLWTTEAGYDPSKGKFVNWLLTITRHISIDFNRKENRYRTQISMEEEDWVNIADQSEDTPEQAVMRISEKDQIRNAFRYLNRPQQQLIELLYWQGYTLSEIAASTGQPLGTIKSRLHQTLRILRKHLQRTKEE